eukprot:6460561-Amphidinium_carterae.1
MELPAILDGRHLWGVSLKHLSLCVIVYGVKTCGQISRMVKQTAECFSSTKSQFHMELHSSSPRPLHRKGRVVVQIQPYIYHIHVRSHTHMAYHHVYSWIF